MASHRGFSRLALIAAVVGVCWAVPQEEDCPDGAATCDASSLLQHRQAPELSANPSVPLPSCAALSEPAHRVSVPVEGFENYVDHAAPGSGLPESAFGIFWMDQTGYYMTRPDAPNTGGTYETLPGKSAWYKRFPHNFPMFAPELLTTFAGSTMDNETRCATASRRTNQWVWANTTGTANGTEQWTTTAGYAMHFCFNEAMDEITIKIELCNNGGTTNSKLWLDMGRKMIKRPWGWERLNVGHTLKQEVSTRYAAWQIVDGNGKPTEHYQAFVDFMKTRCWYGGAIQSTYVPYYNSTECTSSGGYLVNMGNGTMVIGRPGAA